MTLIDPVQREMNRKLGITDQTFLQYHAELTRQATKVQAKQTTAQDTALLAAVVLLDPVQRDINRQLGISDETFIKYYR